MEFEQPRNLFYLVFYNDLGREKGSLIMLCRPIFFLTKNKQTYNATIFVVMPTRIISKALLLNSTSNFFKESSFFGIVINIFHFCYFFLIFDLRRSEKRLIFAHKSIDSKKQIEGNARLSLT